MKQEIYPSRCRACRRALTYWKGATCWMAVGVVLLLILLLGVAVEEATSEGGDKNHTGGAGPGQGLG